MSGRVLSGMEPAAEALAARERIEWLWLHAHITDRERLKLVTRLERWRTAPTRRGTGTP